MIRERSWNRKGSEATTAEWRGGDLSSGDPVEPPALRGHSVLEMANSLDLWRVVDAEIVTAR